MNNYPLTKDDKFWILVKEGALHGSKSASTKAENTAMTSEFLNGKTASLKIHKEDGTTQKKRTIPRPPPPRKRRAELNL
ncbi:DUF2188 domain-containing protein [Pseudomonas sp. NFACC25]|uniref:DUF2188 domain-containing protein n=1 Tax=Pseudomonas sp. NFACC25 TaxID=1566188 RepID=UPI000B84416F|nr:DUF2188 domain-containing protein [Pseudomonas sp. NFACC25]